ncbi:hypothetical protein ACQ859_22025 [Roseateles chitinivorans]|uniref:hypothetical protein n=1 Tax=Roseateles chitinivorans TaxID=2917965 RepID=UPI003D669080
MTIWQHLQKKQIHACVAVALAGLAAGARADAGEAPQIFDGYEAFYATLPDPLFTAGDARKRSAGGLGEPAGDFWKWTAQGKARVLSLTGPDAAIDGRRLPASRAQRFDGEGLAPALGRSATVYANDEAVCIEGVPGSASGTAVRHVRVTLITQPYGAAAKRFELPSLFASCLGLTRIDKDVAHGVGFYRASYRWPKSAPAPEGVTFEAFALKGGAFVPLQQTVTATFVETDNVYRFTTR